MEWANQILISYLQNLETIKASLQPILERMMVAGSSLTTQPSAGNNKKERVVVVVCNYSHAMLLLNFYCAAKAAGVTDLSSSSSFLIFAMDRETAFLAQQLGFTTFYHESLFSFVSANTTSTATYGSMEYARIMIAKVFSVHLVNALGYDVLFHDVDIVPLRADYLKQFIAITANQYDDDAFDLYFQHDVNTSPQYAPWSANSGLYLARSNSRTRYLFHKLRHSLDLIIRSKSHQATLTTVLSEVAVMFGLKTKVLSEYSHQFLVGYHFHHDSTFMKNVMLGVSQPYAFHINWNENQDEKKKYCEQMGMWYIDPTKTHCSTLSLAEMQVAGTKTPVLQDCCITALPPPAVCHYRDKPSKTPCPDSPMIESGVSFW